MRSIVHAEQAFRTQLVENTRKLIANESLALKAKLAVIQREVQANATRIAALREAKNRTGDKTRVGHICRLIALRECANGYLVATAKFLVNNEGRGHTLRQRPRHFAVPSWETGSPYNQN